MESNKCKIMQVYDNNPIKIKNSYDNIKYKSIEELNNNIHCMFNLSPKLDLIRD